MAKAGVRFNFRDRLLLRAVVAYPKEVREVLRPAVRAGAQLLRDEMRTLAPKKTGLLRSSIYMAYSEDRSAENRVTFHIGPNMKKAPHWWLIENGHWLVRDERRIVWVPAKPYIRPTWDSLGAESVRTVRTTLVDLLRARLRAGSGGAA